MDVPGALVWAALAFFADFIPRIGGYVMALPPVVLSLTMGPMTAIWVGLFYLVSTEILGSVVAPKIRGSTMQLHPVLIIFFTLAFALAFGLLGAIVGRGAAFSRLYSEFYRAALRRDQKLTCVRPCAACLPSPPAPQARAAGSERVRSWWPCETLPRRRPGGRAPAAKAIRRSPNCARRFSR